MTDRRSLLKNLAAAIPGAALIGGTASFEAAGTTVSASEVSVEKKTILVFKLNTRVPAEVRETLQDNIRKYLDSVGITQPALLLPSEIDVMTLEVPA